MKLEPHHQARLLGVARESIMQGLQRGQETESPCHGVEGALAAEGASFVTLTTSGELRGCCGSVEAHQGVLRDVWKNAWRAAFGDPRFPSLASQEVQTSWLEIAILSPLQSMTVASEQHLMDSLRPGVDGLLMSLGWRRATFLPKVWEKLPEPSRFLAHLKRKMGVSEDFWDDTLVFQRYETREFGGALVDTEQARGADTAPMHGRPSGFG